MGTISPITPWGEIGYITFKRTYARKHFPDFNDSPTEEFHESVERVIQASNKQLNVGFTKKEEKELREILLQLKGSVAGRFLWQLGTTTVDTLGLPSLQNCAGVIVDEAIRPFTWTMDMLMLGSGVGYNIQRQHINKLPTVREQVGRIVRHDFKDADYILPDNRQGWVKLLGKVLKAYFYSGEGFTYSTQLVRGKNAPIKGFGGTASGPDVLCDGIQDIIDILETRKGQKLRSIDILDIMNIIGSIVVAGNVRRSAQIAIGDCDDIEFLKAKRWDLGSIPNWRAMSNNSVACNDTKRLPKEFWETYQQGEPYGLINFRLLRSTGRLGDTQYKDLKVFIVNPCAEQGLENKETCCLADVFLPNIKSKEELFKVVTYLYRICKHSLTLPCHLKDTEEVVHRNMRMGIGVTGLLECPEKWEWLSDCYEYLRQFDLEYSALHGFPPSIKLTTIKPSGTLSLLPGVTPGAHPSPAGPYYIRRIRMSADSNLVQVCRHNGYNVEPQIRFDGTTDPTTVVVEFPCKVPNNTPIGDSLGAIQHLEIVKKLQTIWSDNAVSCTIYYRKEELPEIKKWLRKNYKDGLKTVSFLLYHGHGFIQAPYETITKEQYNEMILKVKPITSISVSEADMDLNGECSTGACPIK